MPPALLTGLRVLSVEQYGAGPFGTQWLSDLGAEVIKIENPQDGGDVSRANGPHFGKDLPATADSYFYHSFNRNKRSITLNLMDPRGQAIFHKLVKTADAVASNLRGDVPEKIGITYGALASIKPDIVCAHLTGYGRNNARAKWPGYDYLMQAEAGYFDLTGDPDGPPSRFGLSYIDMMTGTVLALMLVSGVMNARQTGKGRDLDISLFDLAVFNLNYVGHWQLNAGARTTRLARSSHPSITPCQSYKTKDGWIFLMCNKEKFWPLLCNFVGHPEWSDDERMRRFSDRLKNRTLVTELLDGALSKRTTQEWITMFGGAIPCAPILDVAQALDNPFVTGRGAVETIETPEGGALKLLASPIRGDGDAMHSRRGPTLGEDTSAVLREIGITADDEATLRRDNVL